MWKKPGSWQWNKIFTPACFGDTVPLPKFLGSVNHLRPQHTIVPCIACTVPCITACSNARDRLHRHAGSRFMTLAVN